MRSRCGRCCLSIHADANELPFADGFFDVLTSINSLFFYVNDGDFLRDKILRCVKPGGEIGVIVPGFYREYADGIPENLQPHWADELNRWHTVQWWVDCFSASGVVDVTLADTLPDGEGNAIYRRFAKVVNAHENPFNVIAADNITFIRIVAKRREV